jgi:hypothetical protein
MYGGTFEINVVGNPIKSYSIRDFEATMGRKVLAVDIEAKVDERNFQGITYNITWTGTPRNMAALSAVWNYLRASIGVYLRVWTFKVVINLSEKGGG